MQKFHFLSNGKIDLGVFCRLDIFGETLGYFDSVVKSNNKPVISFIFLQTNGLPLNYQFSCQII